MTDKNDIFPINNDELAETIEKQKNYIRKSIAILDAQIKKSPEGKLRISYSKGCPQFYCVTKETDRMGKYINKKHEELKCGLAQKDYCIKARKNFQEQLDILENFSKSRYFNKDATDDKIKPAARALIKTLPSCDADFIGVWEKLFALETTDVIESDLVTDNGEKVRSKSEILIANALKKHGIPYRYEYPFSLKTNLGMKIFHPDFTCFNVKKRKTILWEHYGMMGDPEYVENSIGKRLIYEQNGFVPGEDIIFSFESSKISLNSTEIERIINNYLL